MYFTQALKTDKEHVLSLGYLERILVWLNMLQQKEVSS
jgi:hypothetical protein